MAATAPAPTGSKASKPQVVHVRTRRTLDLRTVEPARRQEVATELLGPERGRKLVADFNRWEVARKKRLAAR